MEWGIITIFIVNPLNLTSCTIRNKPRETGFLKLMQDLS